MMAKTDATLEEYVESIRDQVRRNALGLSGQQVVDALMKITDELNETGIDDAWKSRFSASKTLESAYDLIWLVPLAMELCRIANRPKRKKKSAKR
jgi:hypothetical protein